MNILVFSDTHGRIPLMLRLVAQFQWERDTKIDLVLVTGDLGVWPDLNKLDNSTRKYCQREPAELSFQCFAPFTDTDNSSHELYPASYIRRARTLLDSVLPDIDAPVIFVGGNHEDYEYLQLCRDRCAESSTRVDFEEISGEITATCIPVEASGRLWWLPPGAVVSFNGLTIAGLSGIDAAADGRDPSRYPDAARITEDSAMDACIRTLDAVSPDELDVLLSHDGVPNAVKPGKGSSRLAEVVQALNPRFHFFGHYHRAVEPNEYVNLQPQNTGAEDSAWRTIGIHVNKLAFRKNDDRLRDQCLLHLQSDGAGIRSEFVADCWLDRIGRNNWQHVS